MRRSAFFLGGARRLRRPHARSFSDIRTPSGKSALRRPFSFLTNAVPLPAAPGVPASLRPCVLAPPSCSCTSVDAHRTVLCALCCVRCAVLRAGVSAAVSPFSGVVRARLAGARLFLRTRRGARRGVFVPGVGRGRQGKAQGVLRFCERRIRCAHFRRSGRRLLEYRLTAAVVPVFVDLIFWVSIAPCFFAS